MKEEIKRIPIIYCRVSSERQMREGGGLESQEQRCRTYCVNRGYGEPTKVFKDSFTGGGDFMARPAMRSLLEYVDSKPHHNFVVVFDNLKRFARDVEFHLKLRTAFRTRGIVPECLNFSFDESPEGQYVEVILAAGAELERNQNKRQVIQKQKARLERGYWAFHAPKGYEMRRTEYGNTCFPNSAGLILKEGLEGFAYKRFVRIIDLARFLQEKGFFSKKCHAEKYLETTKKLLLDPFYAGFIEYEKWDVRRQKGKHEGVISEEVYFANVKRINGEARDAVIRQDIREEFPLRGLVCCSECGRKMTAYYSRSKTGKRHPYYSCQYRSCALRSKTVKQKDIDDGFKKLVKDNKPKSDLVGIVGMMFEDLWNDEIKGIGKQSELLIKQKSKLEEEIGGLADESIGIENLIVKRSYQKRIEEKSIELEKIEEKLGKEIDYVIPYRTSYDQITGMIKSPYKIWEKGTVKQKQELFSFMFDDKIVFVHEMGYRTPEKSCLYKLFDRIEAGHTLDVEMGEIESPCKRLIFEFLHVCLTLCLV